MIPLTRLVRGARALFRRETLDRELDDEMRFHIDMETEDLVRRRGLSPEEARRQALLAFGGVTRHKEAHGDARGVRWLEDFVQDVRYAVRGLIRAPGFTVAAVSVLALGIGAGTAVFSAVDAVLLERLPYPDDERLVRVYLQNSPTNRYGLSTVDLQALETQARSLSAVGGARGRRAAVLAAGEPERLPVVWATSGYFRALGVRPARGRALQSADDPPGAAPVALVTDAFAARQLGGAEAAVGRSLVIDGVSHVVVGVMAPDVQGLAGWNADVWPVLQLAPPERRGPFGMLVVARLADGVTLDQARRDLADVSVRIFPEWAASYQDSAARLTPVSLREALLADAPRTLLIFAAAVALVLAIAVANVASLMLVRSSGRGGEVAVRTVLGATRLRLLRLVVTESVVLALAGAGAGVLVGALALDIMRDIGPFVPRLDEARLDVRAIAFAVGAALVTGVVVGTYPVVLLLRREPGPGLGAGTRTVGASRRTQAIRGAFVVAEFALALPLLAGAGLLLNSFLRIQRVEPGFDPERLLNVAVSLPGGRYPGDSTVAAYWARALPRVREVPGVLEAGLADHLPPATAWININNFDLVDRPAGPGGQQPTSPWVVVSSDYFTALGVPLLDGRLFTPADSAGAPPVVVVSRAWAKRYFPDGTAVGRTLREGGCTTCPVTTVVGVVGDVRYNGLDAEADAMYSPLSQGWPTDLQLFVRTAGPPDGVIDGVRAALRSVDPGVPLDDAAPMEERLYAAVAQPRHWATLVGGYAVTAVVLAAVGIFGMLSYTVSSRWREIGMRMALGARPGTVVGMIVRRGMRHAVTGAAMGLAAAILGLRWLGDALYGVGSRDVPTLATVTLLLLAVAAVACWLPARRASMIDPVRALRVE